MHVSSSIDRTGKHKQMHISFIATGGETRLRPSLDSPARFGSQSSRYLLDGLFTFRDVSIHVEVR